MLHLQLFARQNTHLESEAKPRRIAQDVALHVITHTFPIGRRLAHRRIIEPVRRRRGISRLSPVT